jgi:glutamine synthetase
MEIEKISNLRNFLEIPYDKLEKMNLDMIQKTKTKKNYEIKQEVIEYLTNEERIKAVTICFSNIEGRLHMLDYNKKYLLDSFDNLTFDGSSVRGFSNIAESDLRLEIDWTSFLLLPADVFGPGKVIVFAFVLNADKSSHPSDFRGQLKNYLEVIKKEKNFLPQAAAEVEGFLLQGENEEVKYNKDKGFSLISTGGYYHSLPLDTLRKFIDRSAEAQRAMGFNNEKDHCEVAPSQFELNFSYADLIRACDQIQLYKLTCRQIAADMGMTASFLPKPIANINGNGMHINLSFSQNNKNIFYDKNGKENLSKIAWDAVSKILNHAPELCLILNSSVNSYRRLDPNFEAPNIIKVSSKDRSSMIRIPAGNEKTTRIEIRSVAPDANPYMVLFAVMKTIFEGKKLIAEKDKRPRSRFLPGDINDAIKLFKNSIFIDKILSAETKEKYLDYKTAVANRSPRLLGTIVKTSEIVFHHEVTNQILWNRF